jgi:hypothetical protein
MKMQMVIARTLAWLMIALLAAPPQAVPQQKAASGATFSQEELDQVVAPIALHPDPLISQILMASTYPLEVVQADRWAQQNKSLKGDAVTAALEKQDWDPSVKSLVAFPQVLTMMSEKLDWTQKLGDAFLADEKKVLDTIQSLRAKAQASGNLKTTKEQTVIIEEKIIKIEPANPQVIYVPSYNPTVVYGSWPYPAYPPYAYYPPGYVASSMMSFGAGMAMGAAFSGAWGYGWGDCDYNGGKVKIDNSKNVNFSGNNIDRGKYANQLPAGGKGDFRHNPEHRKGVSYRDQGTAQKFNRASTNDAIKSREQFRGRTEQGRQDLARDGASNRAAGGDRGGQGLGGDRGSGGLGGAGDRASVSDRGGQGVGGDRGGASQLGGSGSRGGAFEGVGGGGSSARSASQRGSASRGSFSGGGGARGGGGGGRGGGGGGGGRRR